MKITVPATSANLGCGFDSVGIALELYLELEVLEKCEKWHIYHELDDEIPCDETNLIIQTALGLFPDMQPHKIKMTSRIPLERGLGSSSSAIVAGIELACALGKNMSREEKLLYACQIEGHPDNVAPAILGGLVVGAYNGTELVYTKLDFPNCEIVAYIPDYKVSTTDARKVLPDTFSRRDAVLASAIGNVMVASLARGDIQLAGKMMEMDLFHEKYRSELIPELPHVRAIAKQHGAYATYLSGAGSTILTFAPNDTATELARIFRTYDGVTVMNLKIDSTGARIKT
ncbi:MAG: homoserine kinase [Prevotellaceae bacterium]|jgi:homoserine kinase|nr:homoserine kinase [Prevotellaceae bacterium]